LFFYQKVEKVLEIFLFSSVSFIKFSFYLKTLDLTIQKIEKKWWWVLGGFLFFRKTFGLSSILIN